MCHFGSFGKEITEVVNKLHSLTAEKEGSDGQRKFMKRHTFYVFPCQLEAAFMPALPLSLRFVWGKRQEVSRVNSKTRPCTTVRNSECQLLEGSGWVVIGIPKNRQHEHIWFV